MLTVYEKCLIDSSSGGSLEKLYLDNNVRDGLDDLEPGIYPDKTLTIVQNRAFVSNRPLSSDGHDAFLIASSGTGYNGKGQGKVMVPNYQEIPEILNTVAYEDCGASWDVFALGLAPGDIVRVLWQWGGYIHPSTYYIVRTNGIIDTVADEGRAVEVCRQDHIASPFRFIQRGRKAIAPLKDWQNILP